LDRQRNDTQRASLETAFGESGVFFIGEKMGHSSTSISECGLWNIASTLVLSQTAEITARLGAALVLGSAIGINRDLQGKAAEVGVHALVTLGAAAAALIPPAKMSRPISRFSGTQKKACHHVYDTKKKKLVKVPDHKTRLAATTLSRAYHEGKPVERSIAANVNATDFPSLIEKMKQSSAFQALENPLPKAVESIPAPSPEAQ
jgi:hypothetical protein